MAKKQQITLRLSRGKEKSEIKVSTAGAISPPKDEVIVAIDATGEVTKSEALECLRQIESHINLMDWPGA